jgi:hypothetical protein
MTWTHSHNNFKWKFLANLIQSRDETGNLEPTRLVAVCLEALINMSHMTDQSQDWRAVEVTVELPTLQFIHVQWINEHTKH